MEGVHLHPMIDARGVRYFDPGRVEEVAARREGGHVVTLELEPEQHQRAKALCTAAGTTLPAWIREQIATLLAG